MKGLMLFLGIVVIQNTVDANTIIEAIENSGRDLPDFLKTAKVIHHRHIVCDLSNNNCVDFHPNRFTLKDSSNDKNEVRELFNIFKKRKAEIKRLSGNHAGTVQSSENVSKQDIIQEQTDTEDDSGISKMFGYKFRPMNGLRIF